MAPISSVDCLELDSLGVALGDTAMYGCLLRFFQ